jgi:hypothetical protein
MQLDGLYHSKRTSFGEASEDELARPKNKLANVAAWGYNPPSGAIESSSEHSQRVQQTLC